MAALKQIAPYTHGPAAAHLRVTQPRCPFCHNQVAAGERQVGCPACRAWHHQACWEEGRDHCSACGREGRGAEPLRGAPGSRGLLVSWLVVGLGTVLLEAGVLPAFRALSLELGLSLPLVAEFAVGRWRWGLALLPLSLLFAAALSTREQARRRLKALCVLALSALCVFYVYAFSLLHSGFRGL